MNLPDPPSAHGPGAARRLSAPDAVEVELIRSLYETFVPPVVMSLGFAGAGSLIAWQTGDAMLLPLLIGGCLACIARLWIALTSRSRMRRENVTIEEARRHEWRFALSYFAFAALLGLFGLRTMLVAQPEHHMLMMCLLVGYCAGIAAGTGLRPLIAIPCIFAAMTPAIAAAFTQGSPAYWCTGLLATALLGGGIQSILRRHHRALRHTRQRLTFAVLAREDGLTELPNRLALREWFELNLGCKRSPGRFAVHYLDLNGFKPINDTYGHPIGDELLTAVAQRITRTIRASDIAARLGGDEFAIIQRGIGGDNEAELLGQRLTTALAKPFQLGELPIAITASIGYVLCDDRVEDLEALLSLADEALYASKRASRSVTGCNLADRAERWAA